MHCLKYSSTFLLFYCSSIAVLNGAGLREDIPITVQTDDGTLSKETINADWNISDNDIDFRDGSSEVYYDSNEGFGDKLDIELTEKDNQGRFKRAPVFADSGYGSRLTAGSELARDLLILQKVFGAGGPGKRADPGMLNRGEELYAAPGVLLKRDHGYGSRVRAGQNIADSLAARDNLFGMYGPGRKRSYFNSKYDGLQQLGEVFPVGDTFSGERGAVYKTQKRRIVTDSGYGSRIGAASKLARDLSAIDDVFGKYGPGRR